MHGVRLRLISSMDYRETASANREETKTQNATLYASSLGEREGA